jgi:hypothetical protein
MTPLVVSGAAVLGVGLAGINGPATVTKQAVGVAPPPPAGRTALEILATIPIRNETPTGYDRPLFGYPAAQSNGCNTRDRVLESESRSPAQIAYPGCVVIAGDWVSDYDNVATSDPTDLEVDHVVALKEARDSGDHHGPIQLSPVVPNGLHPATAAGPGLRRPSRSRDHRSVHGASA